jgi:hypothetical protein
VVVKHSNFLFEFGVESLAFSVLFRMSSKHNKKNSKRVADDVDVVETDAVDETGADAPANVASSSMISSLASVPASSVSAVDVVALASKVDSMMTMMQRLLPAAPASSAAPAPSASPAVRAHEAIGALPAARAPDVAPSEVSLMEVLRSSAVSRPSARAVASGSIPPRRRVAAVEDDKDDGEWDIDDDEDPDTAYLPGKPLELDDELVQKMLDKLRSYGNCLVWLQAVEWQQRRNQRECQTIAQAVDALVRGKGELALSVLLRRLVGVQLADETGQWEVCDAITGSTGAHSLLPRQDLRRALKEAATMCRLQERSSRSTAKSRASGAPQGTSDRRKPLNQSGSFGNRNSGRAAQTGPSNSSSSVGQSKGGASDK